MTFEGRSYKVGFGARSIRFVDREGGGVATTTYSYKLTEDERAAMARRRRRHRNRVSRPWWPVAGSDRA